MRLLPFAKWLWQNIQRRGYSVKRVADYAGMHDSHLHKIIKSYLPQYAEYPRPGYEKTVLIGQLFSDVPGALLAAEYTSEKNADEPTTNNAPSPALSLVYETLARRSDQGSVELTEAQMDALIDDIEEYANMRLSRTVRQSQSQSQTGAGKQSQRQKQEAT